MWVLGTRNEGKGMKRFEGEEGKKRVMEGGRRSFIRNEEKGGRITMMILSLILPNMLPFRMNYPI